MIENADFTRCRSMDNANFQLFRAGRILATRTLLQGSSVIAFSNVPDYRELTFIRFLFPGNCDRHRSQNLHFASGPPLSGLHAMFIESLCNPRKAR